MMTSSVHPGNENDGEALPAVFEKLEHLDRFVYSLTATPFGGGSTLYLLCGPAPFGGHFLYRRFLLQQVLHFSLPCRRLDRGQTFCPARAKKAKGEIL